MNVSLPVFDQARPSLLASAFREGRERDVLVLLEIAPPDPDLSLDDIALVLREAASPSLRNAAALALLDRDAKEHVAALVDLIGRPDVAGQSGTLLYVLDELGGLLPFPTFAAVVGHGSFEARAEALTMLADDRVVAGSRSEFDAGSDRLTVLAAIGGRDAAEAARTAMDRVSSVRLLLP